MRIPVLETDRLIVRPFVLDDLAAVHDLLDVQLAAPIPGPMARCRWGA